MGVERPQGNTNSQEQGGKLEKWVRKQEKVRKRRKIYALELEREGLMTFRPIS